MWELINRKAVRDFDGFWTEYSLYQNTEDGTYVCVFGDSDIYGPEDEDWDFETDLREEAEEWFDCYDGFEDELDEDYMPSREDYLEWAAASCGMDYFSYTRAF